MGARLRSIAALAVAVVVFAASDRLAHGQERSTPGEFDYYVLSLSWSPSFCEAAAERRPDRAPSEQCGARPYSFVVHGLWPQFERGFPERCQNPPPRLNRDIVSSMLELMPARRLIYHEWDTHGTCSGLSPRAYFELVRKARAAVTIPAAPERGQDLPHEGP
jgi:ribonuclease T2